MTGSNARMDKPQGEQSSTEYRFPNISATSIVLANLIPLAGVLFWGWDAKYIVLLWWAEVGITWFFGGAKLHFVSVVRSGDFSVGNIASHIIRHLAGFCILMITLHLLGTVSICAVLFPSGPTPASDLIDILYSVFLTEFISKSGPLFALAALTLRHGISFLVDFIAIGEYRSPVWQNTKEIHKFTDQIINHRLLMVVAFIFLASSSNSVQMIIVLQTIKIYVELREHKSDRKKAAGKKTKETSPGENADTEANGKENHNDSSEVAIKDAQARLMEAASDGLTWIVRMYLVKGVDVNARALYDVTPLMRAATNGHTETASLLLNYGANVNALTTYGATALMFAAMNGHKEVLELLIDWHADLNAKTDFGKTARKYAADAGHSEIVELLERAESMMGVPQEVDASAEASSAENVNATEIPLGNAALIQASLDGDNQAVLMLLQNGADINSVTKYGETALMLAAMRGHIDIVRILLADGADVNERDEKDRTALMYADQAGYTEIAQMLKKAGAEE